MFNGSGAASQKVAKWTTFAVILTLLSFVAPAAWLPQQAKAVTGCVLGSSSSCPANSARQIIQATGTTTNGLYWINLNINGTITATQVYCIMDPRLDGGGWMLAMKGTNSGTDFYYENSNWTSNTTVNASDTPGPISRSETGVTTKSEDAKYNVFNYYPGDQVLALFPTVTTNNVGGKFPALTSQYGFSWEENYSNGAAPVDLNANSNNMGTAPSGDYCPTAGTYGVTLLSLFSNGWRCRLRVVSNSSSVGSSGNSNNAPSGETSYNYYSEVGNNVFSTETYIGFFGFNYDQGGTGGSPGIDHKVRFGFGWNENGATDETSPDVTGGIGITSSLTSNLSLSPARQAGDYTGCCQTQSGLNESMSFEMYVRGNGDPEVTTGLPSYPLQNATTATLNGTAQPGGSASTIGFCLSTTSVTDSTGRLTGCAYPATMPSSSSVSTSVSVSAAVSGLTTYANYYYQLVETNTSTGAVQVGVVQGLSPGSAMDLQGVNFSTTSSGTTWSDSSANLANPNSFGTATSSISSTSLNSVAFTGTQEFVSPTPYASVSTGATGSQFTAYSLDIWFKTSTAGGKLIGFENTQNQTGNSSGNSYDRMLYVDTNGYLEFGMYNPNTSAYYYAKSLTAVTDGTWRHVVATYDGNNMVLYINGAQVASTAFSSSGTQNYTGYWRVGGYKLASWANAADGYFTGSINRALVYNNVALSWSQVQSQYNAGLGLFGVPDAPSGITNSATTATSETVAWSAPNNNGSSITAYEVDTSIDNNANSQWIVQSNSYSSSTLSTLLNSATSGMNSGYLYARVRAQNANGWGPFSAATILQSTITYQTTGTTTGSLPTSQTVPAKASTWLSANTGNLARAGYSFAGWYSNSLGTGGTFYNTGVTYTPTANVTLYAYWAPPIAISGNATYTAFVGVASRSDTHTVTGGVTAAVSTPVTNTFSTSASSGITIDSSTANSFAFNVTNSVAAGTYYETVTATDSKGYTSTQYTTIIVASAIKFSPTTQTLNVTAGTGGSATIAIAANSGTGTKSITRTVGNNAENTGTTWSYVAGSTSGTLTVNTGLAAGTYTDAFLASDSSAYTSTLTLTINVNPVITFAYPNSTTPSVSGTYTTTAGAGGSYGVIFGQNGTGPLSFTHAVSPAASGITLDTSTGTNQVTVKVSSLVTAGTYYDTITATDTATATSTYSTVITVNPAVSVSASLTSVSMTAGQSSSISITPSGGSGSYGLTWSYSTSNAGISFSSNSSAGTLWIYSSASTGSYTETVTAKDANGATASVVISVTINPALTLTVASSLVKTTLGIGASSAFTIAGGTGSVTASLDTSCTNSGFFSISNSQLTLASNAHVGYYSCTVTATDSASPTPKSVSSILSFSVAQHAIMYSQVGQGVYGPVQLDGTQPGSSPTATWGNNGVQSGADATLYNSPSYTISPQGFYTFDGSSQFGVIPGGKVTTSAAPLTNFTVDAWINLAAYPAYSGATSLPAIVAECKSGTTAAPTGYTSSCGSNLNFAIWPTVSSASPTSYSLNAGYYDSTNGWTMADGSSTQTGLGGSLSGGLKLGTWYYVSYTVSGSGTYVSTLQVNGVTVATGSRSVAPKSSGSQIYIGRRQDTAGYFNGSIGAVDIYNRALTTPELIQVYDEGLGRFANNVAGNVASMTTAYPTGLMSYSNISSSISNGYTTYQTTAGLVATVSDSMFGGTGAYTFGIAGTSGPTVAGTSSYVVTYPATLTSGSYSDTVTGTDSLGSSASVAFNVTVNPAVTISGSASLTTTSGATTAVTSTYTAANGTGSKTFGLTPAISGITMTTGGVISIAGASLSTGTIYETVTATDSLGAVTSYPITITVNAAPTVSGPSSLSTTNGYNYTSSAFSVSNGTGAISYSISPSLTGVTPVNTSNSSFQISIASSGPGVGTYSETVNARDSLGAVGTWPLTIKIAAPVTIGSATNISLHYGDSLSQTYSTTGGSGTYIYFSGTSGSTSYTTSSTSLCPVLESTVGSNTVDQIQGVGSCIWNTPTTVTSAEVLVVGAGGGGAAPYDTSGSAGGGGGAGGVYDATGVALTSSTTVKVGLGGSGGTSQGARQGNNGAQGSNSAFTLSSGLAISAGGGGGAGCETTSTGATCATTAINAPTGYTAGGGGGGSSNYYNAYNAGAGAMGTSVTIPVGGTVYAGQAGGNGGYYNEGGNSSIGSAGGPGGGSRGAATYNQVGAGYTSNITGSNVTYGVGGSTYGVSGYTFSAQSTGFGNGGTGATTTVSGTSGGKGGNGLVIISYATPASVSNTQPTLKVSNNLVGTAAVTLNIPSAVPAGTVIDQYLSAVDNTGISGGSDHFTITITQATPVVSVSAPGGASSVSYGFSTTITASTNTPGYFAFTYGGTALPNCSAVPTTNNVATCSWTPSTLNAGASLTASFTPNDASNYNSNSATVSNFKVTAAPNLTIYGATETMTYNASPQGSSTFTTSGLVAFDQVNSVTLTYSGTAYDGTTYSASTTKPTKAGTYTVTPSLPVGKSAQGTSNASASFVASNYSGVTYSPGTLTISRAAISGQLSYGDTNTATTTYNSTSGYYSPILLFTYDTGVPMMSYSSDNTNVCTVNSSTGALSALAAGTCNVTLNIGTGNNYQGATIIRQVTVNRASRTITLTSSASLLRYGDTATITSVITPSNTFAQTEGVTSYSLAATGACTFNSNTMVVTATAASGTCSITASMTQGDHYLSTTSSAPTLSFTTAPAPTITYGTVAGVSYTGSPATFSLTPTISGLLFNDALGGVTPVYTGTNGTTYGPSTSAPTQGGSYLITPSAWTLSTGSTTNYGTPTYTGVAANIGPIAQSALVDNQSMSAASTPFQLGFTGGNTTGATYSVDLVHSTASGCTVNSNGVLNALSQGTCIVTITLPATSNYTAATLTITVTVAQYYNYAAAVVVSSGGPQIGGGVANQGIVSSGPAACSSACAPTITSFQSNTGAPITSALSNDFVTIIGNGFTGATLVRFGRGAITSIVVNSDTSVTFQVPNGTAVGSYQIKVQAPGGLSAGVALNITG